MNLADLPPIHSEESERALLGAILSQPVEVMALISERLLPDDFFNPALRTIFKSMVEMSKAGTAIDISTLLQYLDDRGLSAETGGLAFLGDLAGEIVSVMTAPAHIQTIREKAALRKIRESAVKTILDTINRQHDPENVIQAAKDRMAQLGSVETPEPLKLLSFDDLMSLKIAQEDTLLGNRWLCRGGAALFVGPSGIGKSSASMQMDILWSVGRAAFGIKPARPLKILCIQAENDDGDLKEMFDGVLDAIAHEFTHEELELARKNINFITENSKSGNSFLTKVVRQGAEKFKPDIIRIDPLLGYLGADPTDTEKTISFLRNGLNPILTKYKTAAIINHHTPKVTNRDTSNWRGSDWMYAGAGGADITNWARAILVIDPTHDPRTFRFIAAKRGGRLDWGDEAGLKTIFKHYCHSNDKIHWVEATAQDMARVEAAVPDKPKARGNRSELPLERVPLLFVGQIAKSRLMEKIVETCSVSRAAAYRRISHAESAGLIRRVPGSDEARPLYMRGTVEGADL